MKWVEDSEVSTDNTTEVCVFCDKSFPTHHGYTAHLRLHGDDLNNHVLNIIASAAKPMSISDIQALSGIKVDVRNSIYRLIEQNKIRRSARGMYAANKGVAASKGSISKAKVSAVQTSIPQGEWDNLILGQLKKHPEMYQRIVKEVMAGIKQYLAFTSEI